MHYSKSINSCGKTTSVQIYKTAAARDIACKAFGFVPVPAREVASYIAKDERAKKNCVPWDERTTNVMNMHLILEYWEDDDAFCAADAAGEFR